MEERQITTKKDEWREGDALKGLDRVQLTIYSYIQSLLLWSLLVLAFAEMWRKSSNYFFCVFIYHPPNHYRRIATSCLSTWSNLLPALRVLLTMDSLHL